MSSGHVTVARFNNPAFAERAKARLEAAGIAALLTEKEKVTVGWHSADHSEADVHVLVAPDDEDRAIDVLSGDSSPFTMPGGDNQNSDAIVGEARLKGSPPAEDDEPAPDIVTSRDEMVLRAYKAQVIAFIFWPLQLYALYCIVGVSGSQQPLTDKSRRRWATTLILHCACWVFVAMVAFLFLARPMRS